MVGYVVIKIEDQAITVMSNLIILFTILLKWKSYLPFQISKNTTPFPFTILDKLLVDEMLNILSNKNIKICN